MHDVNREQRMLPGTELLTRLRWQRPAWAVLNSPVPALGVLIGSLVVGFVLTRASGGIGIFAGVVGTSVAAGVGSYWSPCGSAMVGTLVSKSGRPTLRYILICAAHSAGAMASAALAGLVLASFARALLSPSTAAFGALLIIVGTWEGMRIPIAYPQSPLQAPRSWAGGTHHVTIGFLYGLVLGSNLFTRIGTAAYYGVLGACILLLPPIAAAVMFALYGLLKTWPIWVFGLLSRSESANLQAADGVHRSRLVRSTMHFATGITVMLAAGLILGSL